jgi:hypothetical protein
VLASLAASLTWTSYVAFAMFFPPLRSTESKAMIVECEGQPTESLAREGVPLEILCSGNHLLPVVNL